MAKETGISWCDSTFNPWIGCTKISPGCKYCYAETLDKRQMWDNQAHWGPTAPRRKTSSSNWRQPLAWNKKPWSECQNNCGWRGEILKAPTGEDGFYHCPKCGGMTTPTRQRVFCASLADVFEDNDQLIDWRLELFRLIQATPNLDWLILTKRPALAAHFFRLRRDLLTDNIWMGASVENQEQAEIRIGELINVPARIRFLSVEPLLAPVNLLQWLHLINWVIIGGESGSKARPFDMAWARSIIDQCRLARVPVFMKQVGSNPFYGPDKVNWLSDYKGGDPAEWPEALQVRQFPETTNVR